MPNCELVYIRFGERAREDAASNKLKEHLLKSHAPRCRIVRSKAGRPEFDPVAENFNIAHEPPIVGAAVVPQEYMVGFDLSVTPSPVSFSKDELEQLFEGPLPTQAQLPLFWAAREAHLKAQHTPDLETPVRVELNGRVVPAIEALAEVAVSVEPVESAAARARPSITLALWLDGVPVYAFRLGGLVGAVVVIPPSEEIITSIFANVSELQL